MSIRRLSLAAVLAVAAAQATGIETFYVASNTTNEVYRVTVFNSGMMGVAQTISNANMVRPYGMAINYQGDLLVNGRGPCTACPGGTLTRYHLTTCGPNGPDVATASGNGLANPHGALAIGDLAYMVDTFGNRIVRYSLATPGAPVFVGADPTGAGGNGGRSLIFHPALGEVLMSDCCSLGGIRRYAINPDGSLTPRGTITGNSMSTPHSFAIAPWGELFVANITGNSVSRFTFNENGNAVPSGLITGNGLSGPVSAAFLASGELMVLGHINGVITRFNFDANRNVIPVGSTTLPTGCGEMVVADRPASFASAPATNSLCPADTLSLTVVGGSPSFTYQWQILLQPNTWTNLTDGPRDLFAQVSGSTAGVLTLTGLTVNDAGTYRCIVTTTCGTESTSPSRVLLCQSDADCDSDSDSDDIAAFFGLWEAGENAADVDGDGDTDSDDVIVFFSAFESGC